VRFWLRWLRGRSARVEWLIAGAWILPHFCQLLSLDDQSLVLDSHSHFGLGCIAGSPNCMVARCIHRMVGCAIDVVTAGACSSET
jgi:hypothetical protein